MIPRTNPTRLLGEALERYAQYAIVALIIVPITPDVVVDFVSGNITSGLVRSGVILVLVLAAGLLLSANRRRSTRRHANARAGMAEIGHYKLLVLPLSLKPEYRAVADRAGAESVPELLIDGAGSVEPSTVVLVRSPQIEEEHYRTFVDNLAEHRPGLVVLPLTITDVNNPVTVADDVRAALTKPRAGGASLADDVAAGASAVVDITGATAPVSIGLARVAYELQAHCVYVSGKRGPGGRFEIGTQDRHLVALELLFGPR